MTMWILPSLRDVLAKDQLWNSGSCFAKAESQWRISLAATEHLLKNLIVDNNNEISEGLVLTAPTPVFSQPEITQNLDILTFTTQPFNPLALMPFNMSALAQKEQRESIIREPVLPLLGGDAIAKEQFCLIFTRQFRLALVLAEDEAGEKTFLFSFEPEIVLQAWRSLGARVMLNNPDLFARIEDLVQTYKPLGLDSRILMQFSQQLLSNLPNDREETGAQIKADKKLGKSEKINHNEFTVENVSVDSSSRCDDIELLQAFAHEVRTPLTTIRTMTKLLLKQKNLPDTAIKRLETIDRECTEQIDRMELLFRAVELEKSVTDNVSPKTQLTTMCLEQVLQQSIPRWQQAAKRRNLTLDVVLPQQVPMVISNPNMLDRVLTGLMENFTRSLPAGSHIQVKVIPAGNQLKLQLLPQTQNEGSTNISSSFNPPIRKAIGELLTFQPETGVVSLNLAATKHLFQAIGGKLIVRQRPHQGEVLTIFLPLEGMRESNSCFDEIGVNWRKKNKLNKLKTEKLSEGVQSV
ncbi:MAG: HAMP domain-containing sensor histidine kinase [Cyanobacteria bacterium P01_A01_bin.84]